VYLLKVLLLNSDVVPVCCFDVCSSPSTDVKCCSMWRLSVSNLIRLIWGFGLSYKELSEE